MTFTEAISTFGSTVGCISTTIALVTLLFKNSRKHTDKHILEVANVEENKKIQKEQEAHLQQIDEKFEQFLSSDAEFKKSLNNHLKSQIDVNKRMLANIIETTYYQNKKDKTLDMYEFKRVTEAYEIYHGDVVHGNSYISEIYNEMMTWKRV